MNTGKRIVQYFIILTLLVFSPVLIAKTTKEQEQKSLAKLTALHVINTENNTRITLDLTHKTSYKTFVLKNPERFVVDLPATVLATSLQENAITNTSIKKLREGHPHPDTLRLVFELTNSMQVKVVKLNDITNDVAMQLALDFPHATIASNKSITANQAIQNSAPSDTVSTTDEEATQQALFEEQTKKLALNTQPDSLTNNPKNAAQLNPANPSKHDAQQQIAAEVKANLLPSRKSMAANQSAADSISVNPQPIDNDKEQASAIDTSTIKAGKRLINIVIDPGHGGKDPGTSGPMGTHEKDVVLAISKALKEELEKESSFKAMLTRDSDYFIPLRQRLNIARQDKGDMFVAIHADAFINPYASGSSIFALSAHGASSEAARWLAEKENYSELGGVSLSDKSNILRSVLIDLSQTATISSSIQLGNSILRQLGKIGHLHHGFVEQAPFMVLKSPDIPSLLVETGFLSNPLEEQRLRDPYYQRKMAMAIAAGIKTYFWNNSSTRYAHRIIAQTKSGNFLTSESCKRR